MGIDRPDEGDAPVIERVPEQIQRTQIRVEARDRATYYAELRAAVAADRNEHWSEATAGLAGAWAEHETRWPDRAPAGSADEPGSRREQARRSPDTTANAEVERGCDRIRKIEAEIVTPAMRRVEAQDPTRDLVGLEHRCKGEDRLKEKVAQDAAYLGRSPDQALAGVKDAIRYTFCYSHDGYATGVRADIDRLKAQGFAEAGRRNTWDADHYKGINSWWREPDSGHLFEVQFHTRASFEAKQLTHPAYERIRDPATTPAELRELRAFQREVCRNLPVPPGATEIEERAG